LKQTGKLVADTLIAARCPADRCLVTGIERLMRVEANAPQDDESLEEPARLAVATLVLPAWAVRVTRNER
jgi:hypothetical protein